MGRWCFHGDLVGRGEGYKPRKLAFYCSGAPRKESDPLLYQSLLLLLSSYFSFSCSHSSVSSTIASASSITATRRWRCSLGEQGLVVSSFSDSHGHCIIISLEDAWNANRAWCKRLFGLSFGAVVVGFIIVYVLFLTSCRSVNRCERSCSGILILCEKE